MITFVEWMTIHELIKKEIKNRIYRMDDDSRVDQKRDKIAFLSNE